MWGRWLLGLCLGLLWGAAGAEPGETVRVDADWRAHDAKVAEQALIDLGRARQQSRVAALAAGSAGRTADELRHWADYLGQTHTFTAQELALAQQLITRAEQAGETATQFDLVYAVGHHTAYQRDPAVAGMIGTLQALARTLGDPARQGMVEQLKGEQALNEGRASEAIEHFTAALELAPSVFRQVDLLLLRVNAAVNVNVNSGAQAARDAAREDLARVQAALDLRTYRSLGLATHAALGRLAYADGRHEEAVREFRQALALAPASAQGTLGVASTQMSLAENLLALGRAQEAAAVMQQWRLDEAANPAMRFWLATLRVRIATQTDAPDLRTSGARWLAQAAAEDALLASEPRFRATYQAAAAEFYEHTGQLHEALAAFKAGQVAARERDARANELQRLEFQTRLDVAAKDKENARLRARADLEAEQRLRWSWAFLASLAGALVTTAALLVSMRRKRQLAAMSAELAQRNAQLEERSSSRIRLLAAACHDLRQPAHALGLLAELGVDAARQPDTARAWLQDIRRCSATLTDMLGELMDLSKLDGGHYTPSLGPVSLDEILEDVRLQYGETARLKGLAFEAPPCGLHVHSDRQLLRRIVFNLVSNAVKYTLQGRIEIGVALSDGVVRLRVADTGPGIPPDRLDEVFQDYVRLEPQHAADGLGIGLSIVRRAAGLLGHGLTLTSAPGEGTQVALALGGRVDPPRHVAAEPARAWRGDGSLVVILEDDPSVREAMGAVLQRAGYAVVTAGGLEELRARCEPQGVHLLMTDLHLAHQDGLDLVSQVRAWCGRPDLPAVLVTGDLDASVAARAAAVGVHLVHKPLPPRRMLTMVAQALKMAGKAAE